MNYQDYIKYDPEKKQYTDSYGYVIDGVSSKPLPSEHCSEPEIKANRIQLVNSDTAPKIVVDASSSGNVDLILEGKGAGSFVKTRAFVAGTTASSSNFQGETNQVSFTAFGTDSNIDYVFYPKGGDGSLKVGPNYGTHVAIVGNNQGKVTTRYSTNSNATLNLECKGTTGKIAFKNSTLAETLELSQVEGTTSLTSTTTNLGSYPNGDLSFIPRGLGIVSCNSYTAEWNTGMASTQTLGTNVNTKVWFDNLIASSFPAGFITESGGWDTFQNTSGRTITLMVTACIRETTFPTGRTLGLWIARSGASTLQYGQSLLPPTTDTTNGRALNTASIIKLANSETFSIWAHTVAAGVVIGGNGQTYNRPILSYRLMP